MGLGLGQEKKFRCVIVRFCVKVWVRVRLGEVWVRVGIRVRCVVVELVLRCGLGLGLGQGEKFGCVVVGFGLKLRFR